MIRHVAGVGEIVEDVAKAVAFYRDVLGLAVEYEEGSDYATIAIPGMLHFGLWDRRAAAESIFGDRDAAERVPLGFALGFEVDVVDEAAQLLRERSDALVQEPKTEPWGQRVARFWLPSGLIGELAETPWARELPTGD